MVGLNRLISEAVGGVAIQVPQEFEEQARLVLSQDYSSRIEPAEGPAFLGRGQPGLGLAAESSPRKLMEVRFFGAMSRWASWLWFAGVIAPSVSLVVEGFFPGPDPCHNAVPGWLNSLRIVLVLGCILLAIVASIARPGALPLRLLRAILVPIVGLVLGLACFWFQISVLGQPFCFQD
jgi:hypothetical protein